MVITPVTYKGWLRHIVVGGVFTSVWFALGIAPVNIFLIILAIAISHEIGDGDFIIQQGNSLPPPINGILDTLAFLPIPLLYWLFA